MEDSSPTWKASSPSAEWTTIAGEPAFEEGSGMEAGGRGDSDCKRFEMMDLVL